jgi:hypothetical protein
MFKLPDERQWILDSTRHIELGERWVVHKFGNPTSEKGSALPSLQPFTKD